MRKTLLLASIVFLLGAMVSPVYGQVNLEWVGGTIDTGGGSWHTNTNWVYAGTGFTPDLEPQADDTVYIDNDGLALIMGAAQAKYIYTGRNAAWNYYDQGSPGYIKQTDGTLTVGDPTESHEALRLGYAGKSVYDHLGGILNVVSLKTSYDANFWLGGSGYWHYPGTTDDVSATYNISGDAVLNITGTVAQPGGLNIGYWQDGALGTALVNQTGGTVNVMGKIVVGDDGPGEGRYKISAGSMSCGTLHVARYGPGTFQVRGSGSTMSAGEYTQTNNGTLQCDVGNPGISVVGVTETATFESGSTLDVGRMPGVVVEKDEQFVLMTADYIDDQGLTLAAGDIGLWSFTIIPGAAGDSGDNGLLTATRLVISGDLDISGFVGQDDLDIVLAEWGNSAPLNDPRADANVDEFVGQGDLDVVLGTWGQGNAPVPEPASASLLLLGAVAMLKRRWRK